MSHFSVVLIMENVIRDTDPEKITERVDKEMAPFQENNMDDCPKEYLKFNDEEDEYLKQYEEGSQERIVMPDGRLLLPWDETFRATVVKDAPPDLPRRNVPFKETYSTFEEFVKEWHGREERDETYLRYGYWENPNAKWDWFEIGGRWAGFFQLKKGREGAMGKQYNFSGTLKPTEGGKADMCFKSAIDFDRMRDEAEEAAAKLYDKVQEAIKDTPVADSWEIVKADFPDLNKPGEIEKARKKYHDQPRVKAFKKFGIDEVGWNVGVEEYQIPREQYIRNARNNVAVPFAVLKDGKWYEHGRMLMFGTAIDEKDPETWNAIVNKMYDELPDDALLVAIDCHV